MKRTLPFALLMLLALPFSSFAEETAPQQEPDTSIYEQLDVMAHVFDRIKNNYVEEVGDKKMIENAINGMLSALDPHSSYLPADSMSAMTEQTKGEFGGLGIEVTMDRGVVKVVSPIEDTPADRAGIQAGDLIIQIDGQDVQGMALSDAVDMMRGTVGSEIKLKLFRESDKKVMDVVIKRAIIKIIPVKSRLERDGIGYLRITTFNEHVGKEIQAHLKKLQKELQDEDGKDAKLRGLVLDLRNNPGGLLSQAVAAADAFLEQGEIVSTRGRLSEQNQRYNARKGDLLEGKPIVVIINGGSASASEIVAGALQDHRRGVVIGTKSFGKGSVQTIMQLPGGAGMRLTTARYYTPSGNSIQAKGIEPDIEVKPLKVEEIEGGNFPSEASLQGHLELEHLLDDTADSKEKSAKKGKNDKKDAKKERKADDASKQDYQLQRAIDMVSALALWEK